MCPALRGEGREKAMKRLFFMGRLAKVLREWVNLAAAILDLLD
jgi:hypothetical protein